MVQRRFALYHDAGKRIGLARDLKGKATGFVETAVEGRQWLMKDKRWYPAEEMMDSIGCGDFFSARLLQSSTKSSPDRDLGAGEFLGSSRSALESECGEPY
jgi:hypothetical protein